MSEYDSNPFALDHNIGGSDSCRGSRLVPISCVAIPVCKVCSPQVHLCICGALFNLRTYIK